MPHKLSYATLGLWARRMAGSAVAWFVRVFTRPGSDRPLDDGTAWLESSLEDEPADDREARGWSTRSRLGVREVSPAVDETTAGGRGGAPPGAARAL